MTARLSKIQQQLRELIVAPSGVGAALDELGESTIRALDATVSGDAKLSAAERLEVYANAYFYRIHDCLVDDYGALHAVLGAGSFHNVVTAYLLRYPPRHPSLRLAGDRMAEFIQSDPAAASLSEDRRWLGELALLEWSIGRSFDAADAEVLSRDALAAVDPSQWVDLRFTFQPALARLDLDYPVCQLRRAWDDDEPIDTARSELESSQPGAHRILVWRRDERVRYRNLDPAEASSLDLAIAGETFGSLCEQLATQVGDDAAPNHAAALLARWQADALIRPLPAMPPTDLIHSNSSKLGA